MKLPFVYAWLAGNAACAPRAPNAASKIGIGAWPGSPLFANPVRPFASLIARFCCAFLKSSRNPFSKMFTSFRLNECHSFRARLPR